MFQEMIGENVDTYTLHQAYLHFEVPCRAEDDKIASPELHEELPQFSSEDLQVSRIIPFADEELNNEEQDSNMFICVSDVISQVDVIDQYVEGLLTDRGSKWSESSELEIFLTNPRREFLKGFGFGYVLDLAPRHIWICTQASPATRNRANSEDFKCGWVRRDSQE
ncbi:uncharacterized protein LOC135477192 [Liolophura sinensis]|uniref:uncharacterized protein LOC135477192 n=1 Tax=Liolophura sinensis TaxID=3198878 RepID=UPI0031594926